MSLYGKRDPAIARLIDDAEKARNKGAHERAIALIRDAAQVLVDLNKTDEAIDLCVTERDYARAGEIAERARDWKRAAQLWFRGGDFVRAAKARIENGEPMIAADLFERVGDYAGAAAIYEQQEDFVRASGLLEKAGDKHRAADLLVRSISSEQRVFGDAADEACRRAGVLYAEVGMLEMAVRVLRYGHQNVFAGKLLARAGRHEEAIQLLAASGDYLAAAELSRAMGNERGAQMLLGERAEKEGRYAEAAIHFEQAEAFQRAARLYEYADDLPRAAEAHERGRVFDAAAELYEQIGLFADAARCLRAAGREQEAAALEDRAGFREETIRAHAARGDFLAAAEGALTLARSRDPSRYQEAALFLGRIAADHPDWLKARTLLAEVIGEQGDNRGAIGVLGAALSGTTFMRSHVPALYQYGRLLELEGYLAQARQAYRAAIALEPTFRDLADRVVMLGETEAPLLRSAPLASAAQVPPVRTVTGVPVRAPLPRSATPAHIPVAPMVVPTASPPPASTSNPSLPASTSNPNLPAMQNIAAPASPPTPPPKEDTRPASMVGVVLRGRFRVEGKLGRGAQAEVYLARDLVLDRPVAIKVLSESVAQDKAALERFLREARLAARVNHASCIAIYDFGQEYGVTFMAMEYFKGKTLRERISEAALETSSALSIARDVAEALGAVHAAGIVHRDIKPTNVMVDEQARARLTDFGVAKDAGEEAAAGVMIGTLRYMSPEQARGKEVDARADIFSLGVVLYEMLAGRAPFGGTLDALIKRVKEPPPALPASVQVPDAVRQIVTKCLQKKREHRYADAGALVTVLKNAMDALKDFKATELPVPAAAPPPPPPPPADADDLLVADLL